MDEPTLPASSESRWQVGVTSSIEAPVDQVWIAISTPGNLELAHPFCERNPVTVWGVDESCDQVQYVNGRVFERRFSRWIEGAGYDLAIGEEGGTTSLVSWRLKAVGGSACTLSITVVPYLLQSWPDGLGLVPHALYVRPLLRRYLSSVVGGFEWFVIRGKPVPKNAFGTHPWFS